MPNTLYTIVVDPRAGLHPTLFHATSNTADSNGVLTNGVVLIRDASVRVNGTRSRTSKRQQRRRL